MVTKEGVTRTVLSRKELAKEVFQVMHDDLGHYGKDLTVKEVKT